MSEIQFDFLVANGVSVEITNNVLPVYRMQAYPKRHNQSRSLLHTTIVGWLVALRIYVALAVFQPYRDLEAGDNQSLKSSGEAGN